MKEILYNVTIIIDESVEKEWLNWMKDVHIPEVMATGFFKTYQLQKILNAPSEGGTTFAIQYLAPSMKSFETYQEKYAPRLQEEHHKKYNGKYGAFRTLMEVEARGEI